ncbi:hypothetical protein HU200_009728 [Digitaria exilis]|uniref:Uncharacterized protein n=1 Tax=Digitaria exilis TaxID=1010633 RepID=A0A835FL07_9POAL|nr:hypothetical protein HU200_009728 [Digitaria exilis]
MGYARLALVVAAAAAAMVVMSGVAAWGSPSSPPCMYIFGDSLVDNGNNNNMLSLARANYQPYGIDFHEGPPGRFTNGRTMVDFLSDMLGLRPPLVPPYAAARPSDLPRGLNFASGASGILPETGNNLVDNFRDAVSDMGNTSAFRGNATKVTEHLGRCIFYVGMGSNDYLNNYFMPDYYDTAERYTPRDYASLLLQGYAAQLAELYALGARKFVVAGVGQIGCIPYELARMNNDNQPDTPSSVANEDISISINLGGGNGGRSTSDTGANPTAGATGGYCNETINGAIAIYNKGLLAMVKRFNNNNNNGRGQQQQQMRGARFVFLDTVQSGRDVAANAAAHGFTVLDRGCCGVGRNNGQITCLPLQRPCDDRSKYMFWDAFHPTEAANRIYAAKAFGSNNTAEVYPINVSQLAAI